MIVGYEFFEKVQEDGEEPFTSLVNADEKTVHATKAVKSVKM